MAKACIIVPVFNGLPHLEECLDSIFGQSWKDFRCIIVDDGSTDDSLKLAERLTKGDERFRIIQQEHQGLSVARNAGIKASDADVLLHLDADDLAKPDLVGHVVDFIFSNDLDMAFYDAVPENHGISDFRFHGEQGYFTRRKSYGFGTGKDLLKQMLVIKDFVYSSFLHAVRKDRLPAMFCPGVRAQDQLHTTQCYLMLDKVGHLPETLIVKRCWPEGVSYLKHDLHYAWSKMKSAMELASFAERNGIDEELVSPVLEKMFQLMSESFPRNGYLDRDFLASLSLFDRTMLKEMRALWLHGSRFHTK